MSNALNYSRLTFNNTLLICTISCLERAMFIQVFKYTIKMILTKSGLLSRLSSQKWIYYDGSIPALFTEWSFSLKLVRSFHMLACSLPSKLWTEKKVTMIKFLDVVHSPIIIDRNEPFKRIFNEWSPFSAIPLNSSQLKRVAIEK